MADSLKTIRRICGYKNTEGYKNDKATELTGKITATKRGRIKSILKGLRIP